MRGLVTSGTWIVAGVLVLAGVAKLRRPAGTVAALRSAQLPADRLLVRLLGAVEVVVGVAVLVRGGVLPALAATLLYLGFTGFAVVHRRTEGAACGCFGSTTTPLTGAHVLVDAGAALLAAGGAAAAVPSLIGGTAPGTSRLLAVVLVAAGAWLVQLLLTVVPEWRATLALHHLPGGTA